MAINFPTSPSDGQIYTFAGRTWVYRTSNGAWSAQVQNTPGFYSQTTAPTGNKEGDEWYDESTGIFYRYIYDGNTYQWVEVGPAAIPFAASDTVAGGIEIAIQSEMETATDVVRAVTPGRMQYHPGVCKAWIRLNGTGTVAINASHNVTSITDNGTGNYSINLTTVFSSANYGFTITGGNSTTTASEGWFIHQGGAAPTASVFRLVSGLNGIGQTDASLVSACLFGDQ
jgi:hypothetical protein